LDLAKQRSDAAALQMQKRFKSVLDKNRRDFATGRGGCFG